MTEKQKPQAHPVQLSVARRNGTPGSVFEDFAGELSGVRRCVQLHPDETDPELLRWYVIDTDPDAADAVLAALWASPLIEEAERNPVRKISPKG